MKNFGKYLIIFLLTLMILTAFVACNSDTANNTPDVSPGSGDPDTPAQQEEEQAEEIKDSLPDDLDFNGEIINIHVRGNDDSMLEFYSEGENGDIVNDVIYRRNATVEDRLNVNINVIPRPGLVVLSGRGAEGYQKQRSGGRSGL